MTGISRRTLLKASLAGAAAGSLPVAAQEATTPAIMGTNAPGSAPETPAGAPPIASDTLLFFNADEARFVGAAIDRLIPSDPTWPGARDAGVLNFIDGQLAGAYGGGARMYLSGPWDPEGASPGQGYQLKFTPAELYRMAIAEIRELVRRQNGGLEFADLSADKADGLLKSLESGDLELQSVPSAVFFETLLANTIEGYFSDPIYGGNRDMTSWRMLGFPGAYAQYADLVDQYDLKFERDPVSIATSRPMRMTNGGKR